MASLSERQCQFTKAEALLVLFAHNEGLQVKVQEWNRDLETQKRYVAEGVSKTLDSRHIDKLAVDIYIIERGAPTRTLEKYRALGVYWESLGGRWGGRFGLEDKPKAVQDAKIGWDPYHFEFRK